MAYARSYSTGSTKSPRLVQGIGNSCEKHLDVDPLDCGNKHARCLEDVFIMFRLCLDFFEAAIDVVVARRNSR